MNQDILFADIQFWDRDRKAVNFPAQQAGALITCWVSLAWLQKKADKVLMEETDILSAFSANRFDLEELAENMIEEEEFNQDGDIEIC